MSFEIIKRNYDRGLWSKQMVKVAVIKGVITAEQYKEITGDDYQE
ncbi:XkdX family protein [Clostridium thermosuccinogenes]|nr:XkdX family protein [Pseudoclostridium thermosuccinogenes]NLH00502.1 XkdX family protein [Clostridiales bacterium]PNT91301.1 XkdX family protein [Pseudoclostridium thermosuccinogenes]